ncbi:MAG: rhomboid family intramembrane serine protease [Mycobacteriales bacterium]
MADRTAEPEASAGARCYRHADRETWVSCTRCGRPICPECMRDASVGFHCPECVREASRTVRQPRTTFGGRVGRNETRFTLALIAVNVVAFALQGVTELGLTGGQSSEFTVRFALIGDGLRTFGPVGAGVAHGEYYRLLTAAFLHAGLVHLGLNMYALYILGTQLERLLGGWRYLALYGVTAIGGNTLSYIVHGRAAYSVGASTALFGFFGAYYMIARRLRADTSQILLLIGVNLLFTFAIAVIDKMGHIGGLLAGLAMGAIYTLLPARDSRLQVIAVATLAVALVAVAVVRTQTLGDPTAMLAPFG